MRKGVLLRYLIVIAVLAVATVSAVQFLSSRSTKHSKNPASIPSKPTVPGQSTTSIASPGTVAGGPVKPITGNAFTYGFDFSNQAPDTPGTDPTADAQAKQVLGQFAGSIMDISMYGFGLKDPEPSPGNFDMSGLERRLSLIQSAAGIPVISLIAAPDWMKAHVRSGDRAFFEPPSPDHYQDFADLCAHVAQTFHQVKYFVVWNEMKEFFANNVWDYQHYTAMYNAVFTAVKKVRPDAMVGGPYAVMSSFTTPRHNIVSVINGGAEWGYLDQGMLDAVTYWLKQKVGADFIAVDGATNIAKQDDASITDPLSASRKYAAVDQWIRSQTKLPIWWMESHIQASAGWTDAQAAAARVATIATIAGSGASVGLQWQPQEQSGWADQGLWTSTLQPQGGRATTLAGELLKVLPLLMQPLTIVGGQPTGVLVGTTAKGALLVNTLNAPAQAMLRGVAIDLAPGAVIVK